MRPGGCLYMGRREPRGRASALPRRGPHLYFICPAELNSAGIKVLGPRPKTLGRRKAPPRRRRGPRRGRRIKRAPDVSSGALVRACLLVELHQSGEMLIALLGGSAPPGRGPPGTPSLFYLSGGTEFRRHQGFGPTAQNAWTAQSAAPPSAGPPKRPPYKTGPGRFVRGPCASLFTCRAPPVW